MSFLDDDVKRSRIPSLLNDLHVDLVVASPEMYFDCFGSIELLPSLVIVDSMCHNVFQNLKPDRPSISLNEDQRQFVEHSIFAMYVSCFVFHSDVQVDQQSHILELSFNPQKVFYLV